MIKIKEAIITEGKYDKIKLSQIFDTLIICTNGFNIFKDEPLQKLIRKTAQTQGVIILTDSDRAGFLIRGFLNGICENTKNAYTPQIEGKEKRKQTKSKDGFLGVEGISDADIEKAVMTAATKAEKHERPITKADLYDFGLSGGKNSAELRDIVLKKLDLPLGITANPMLNILNVLFSYDEFVKFLENI